MFSAHSLWVNILLTFLLCFNSSTLFCSIPDSVQGLQNDLNKKAQEESVDAKELNSFLSSNISIQDFRYARAFLEIFRKLSDYKINQYDVAVLTSAAIGTTLFSDYKDLNSILVDASKIGKDDNIFFKLCSERIANKRQGSFVEERVLFKIKNFCAANVLGRFADDNKIILKQKYQDLFTQYFDNIVIEDDLRKQLFHVLNMCASQDKVYDTFSLLIKNYYLSRSDEQVSENNDVLEKISIARYNEFLEQRGKSKNVLLDKLQGDLVDKMYTDLVSGAEQNDYILVTENVNKLIAFFKETSNAISGSKNLEKIFWKVFVGAGTKMIFLKRKDDALKFFHLAWSVATSELKSESLFYIFWGHAVSEDYVSAISDIQKFKLMERFGALPPKLQFWISYNIKKSGNIHLARHLYTNLAENNILDFYSVVAMNELRLIDKESVDKRIISKIKRGPASVEELSVNDYLPLYLNHMKRLVLWINLGNEFFAFNEMKNILDLDKNAVFVASEKINTMSNESVKKSLLQNITGMLIEKKQYQQAFKIIQYTLDRQMITMDEEVVKKLFPFKYFSEIGVFERRIDPVVVLSLIRQESAFNPNAKSSVGARGLMQLMPQTAKSLQKRVRVEDLKNPEINIRLGVEYLKRLLVKYNGNLVFTLAAYNAGENRVKRWVTDVFPSTDPLVMIEAIPFKETKQYVQLIYRNIFFYRLLKDYYYTHKDIGDSFTVSVAKEGDTQLPVENKNARILK